MKSLTCEIYFHMIQNFAVALIDMYYFKFVEIMNKSVDASENYNLE